MAKAKDSAYRDHRENMKDLDDTYGPLQGDIAIRGGEYVAVGYSTDESNTPEGTSPNQKTGYLYEKR